MVNVNHVSPRTVEDFRAVQKRIDKIQMLVWVYLNTIFNIVIIIGNVLYFSIDSKMVPWCEDVSA